MTNSRRIDEAILAARSLFQKHLPQRFMSQKPSRHLAVHSLDARQWGGFLVICYSGRLYALHPKTNQLSLLGIIPGRYGSFQLIHLEMQIKNRSDITLGALSIDRIFRDVSIWPSNHNGNNGLIAEDLFLNTCLRLGFANAYCQPPPNSHTIRRATMWEEKQTTDFVFTFPTEGISAGRKVPLQLTIARSVHGFKAIKTKKAAANLIAYLPLANFFGNNRISYLQAASNGNEEKLWLVGEILKIACSRYLQKPVNLPNSIPFKRSFFNQTTLEVLLPRMKPKLRTEIQLHLPELAQAQTQQGNNAYSVLNRYLASHDTPYDLSLERIASQAW